MPNSKGKKRKHSSDELINVCNITGLDESRPVEASENDNLFDCLEELASAQVSTAGNEPHAAEQKVSKKKSANKHQPPGFHRIPNIKIELHRHLQIENLSTFVLQSCKGLRMPTFERWLLDSKLEEKERRESILKEWEEDPSLKVEFMSKKKKYGRAALYGDLAIQKEQRRMEKERRLLLGAEKFSSTNWEWVRSIEMDPILPSEPLETDPSCRRLLEEVKSVLSAAADESLDTTQKALDIVKELCSTTAEAVSNLTLMETRLGKHQKFGWDAPVGSNKIKKDANVDKVTIEWNDDGNTCTLIYTQKKRASEKNGDKAKQKPKPFLVKLNAFHYHKLRDMFDKTHEPFNTVELKQLSKSQITHVFRSILFVMIIRYSSLAGAQQLKDLRGGGMQGAIHTEVFQCFTKWFGEQGIECFASPFNCQLHHYYSAFPSPDIDGHFGSFGDFFWPNEDFLRDGCWYELNPPFSPNIMGKMANRINELLTLASHQDMNVTFIVIVPTVNESKGEPQSAKKEKDSRRKHSDEVSAKSNVNPVSSVVHLSASNSFSSLIDNTHCNHHIVLPACEHGYVEGSQHLRPTQYKESRYNTSVIVLQSKKSFSLGNGSGKSVKASGKSVKVLDANSFEQDLREAFASRHKMETDKRRVR
ncbi:hypothetical protein ACHAWO_000977 [Cyclotella atomus]|uniref:PCIF1 WW domain-containing protein n=1 Tax=Cyclotella atomus TaxID=382360 RepID=A0ABD3PYS0_9STRA